jgi:hypothetical protein
MEKKKEQESVFATWVFIAILVIFFLIFGFFSYSFVGDKGQPTWDYRTLKDVPAESPYALYKKLPHPQHIKGAEGE